jgi:hypothetical protein
VLERHNNTEWCDDDAHAFTSRLPMHFKAVGHVLSLPKLCRGAASCVFAVTLCNALTLKLAMASLLDEATAVSFLPCSARSASSVQTFRGAGTKQVRQAGSRSVAKHTCYVCYTCSDAQEGQEPLESALCHDPLLGISRSRGSTGVSSEQIPLVINFCP